MSTPELPPVTDSMNEAAPPPTNGSRDQLLYWVCALLTTGMAAAVSSYRVKPLFWFGPAFGALIGIALIALAHALQLRSVRKLHYSAVLLAGIGFVGTLAAFAARIPPIKAADAIVESLLSAMEQYAMDSSTEPPSVGTIPAPPDDSNTPWGSLRRYLDRRYQTLLPLPRAAWLTLETLEAMIVAGFVTRIGLMLATPGSVRESLG